MTTPKRSKAPPPPAGLAASGGRLWRSVTAEYDPEIFEELLLLQAARCADTLDRLAVEASDSPVTTFNVKGDLTAHPALVESRQQAITLSRLLASLRLPSGVQDGEVRPQRRGASRGTYGVRGVGA
jgi:hypothetical protein